MLCVPSIVHVAFCCVKEDTQLMNVSNVRFGNNSLWRPANVESQNCTNSMITLLHHVGDLYTQSRHPSKATAPPRVRYCSTISWYSTVLYLYRLNLKGLDNHFNDSTKQLLPSTRLLPTMSLTRNSHTCRFCYRTVLKNFCMDSILWSDPSFFARDRPCLTQFPRD